MRRVPRFVHSCQQSAFCVNSVEFMLFPALVSLSAHLTVDHGSGSFASGFRLRCRYTGLGERGERWTELLREVVSHLGKLQHIRLHGSRCGGVLRFDVPTPSWLKTDTRVSKEGARSLIARVPIGYPGE